MICRVCAIRLEYWGASGTIPLLKCSRCGAIHADCAKPSEDLYAGLYSRNEAVPPVVAASLDRVVRSMEAFGTRRRWLDIGFGQGALLEAASRAGWLCHGTELSKVAIEKGRERGFITGAETAMFEDSSFDVVSLVEFVEHVEHPAAFLKEARRVLRRGGCLYLTTPNAWSLNRWILGPRWSNFTPPDHVTIFSPPALRKLLTNAGFEKMELRAEGLSPFEVLRHLRAKQAAPPAGLNERTALCTTLSSSAGRRKLKDLANALLSATRLGDSLKARSI